MNIIKYPSGQDVIAAISGRAKRPPSATYRTNRLPKERKISLNK